jgi:hypothetical protein
MGRCLPSAVHRTDKAPGIWQVEPLALIIESEEALAHLILSAHSTYTEAPHDDINMPDQPTFH